MELSICVVTFCHLCQLITDLRRCRMYVSFLALVCLFVVCLFSAFDMKSLSLFEYSRMFRIFKERDISYQKPRTDNRQTHTQKYILTCCVTKKTKQHHFLSTKCFLTMPLPTKLNRLEENIN